MCLKGYVGIKGCGTAEPESGQYINQLPGISLQSIQKIADSEQVTYVSVFNDVEDRAWRRFETDVRNKLRARYNLKTVRQVLYINTTASEATEQAAPEYRGLVIDSGCEHNNFFSLNITSIGIRLTANRATTSIYILDRYGEILDTITAESLTAGLNTVTINKRYAAPMVFIAVDATEMATATTSLRADCYEPYSACMACFGGSDANVYGGTAPTAAPAVITSGYDTHGISAVVTPGCDFTALICREKQTFLNAWMYLLGAELMIERLYSPRINKLTTVDNETAKDLRDLFTAEYQNAMEDAISGMHISNDDGCIECKQTIKKVEALP